VERLGDLVLEAALVALSARERKPVRALVEALRAGDRRLHAELRLALAWAIRHYLARDHPAVRAAYVVGSSLDDEARPASDLDLVLDIDSGDAALRARLEGLNLEVTKAYRRLVPGLPDDFRLLDLHVIEPGGEDGGFRRLVMGSSQPWHALPT
jgi:predicted nucleotidyltransferase